MFYMAREVREPRQKMDTPEYKAHHHEQDAPEDKILP